MKAFNDNVRKIKVIDPFKRHGPVTKQIIRLGKIGVVASISILESMRINRRKPTERPLPDALPPVFQTEIPSSTPRNQFQVRSR